MIWYLSSRWIYLHSQVRAVPWRSILRSVPVYAILFANVGSGWVWYMSMTSLAQYIHDVLKFPIAQVKLCCSLSHVSLHSHNRKDINSSPHSAAYMRQWIGSALVQIMACRLFGAKPLSKPMLCYSQLYPFEQIKVKFETIYTAFHSWKCIWKCRQRNGHFVQDYARDCKWSFYTDHNLACSHRSRDLNIINTTHF